MIIKGRDIAEEILAATKKQVEELGHAPSFAAFVVAPSPATLSYLKVKARQAERAGIRMEVKSLPLESTTEEILTALHEAPEDALIVQLPLPEHVDQASVLEAIPVEKDADVLSVRARREGPVMHPIAASLKDILERGNLSIRGTKAAVVGQGWLVGQPAAAWLLKEGAEVVVVTRESGDLEEVLPTAEVIVSGAGSPGIVTKDLVKQGAAVIDVGTSELGGSITGDVAPDVAQVAGLFTPVPGGVGPIAVAYLMKNVAHLARLRNERNGVH